MAIRNSLFDNEQARFARRFEQMLKCIPRECLGVIQKGSQGMSSESDPSDIFYSPIRDVKHGPPGLVLTFSNGDIEIDEKTTQTLFDLQAHVQQQVFEELVAMNEALSGMLPAVRNKMALHDQIDGRPFRRQVQIIAKVQYDGTAFAALLATLDYDPGVKLFQDGGTPEYQPPLHKQRSKEIIWEPLKMPKFPWSK